MQRSHYRILGLIGQGQFGQVFCALHRQTGKLVALKNLEHRRFPTHLFLRELSCLATLQHPNIVTWQALEHNARGRYLVMDYCEGGTLRDLLESENKLELRQGLKLIEDILLGLEYAHNRNIVHCDIKPENIILNLTSDGWVARISDFGLARLQEQKGTSSGNTGSPAYMAPERFYGSYSCAADLYAVGVMLFELAVGDRPFSGLPGELMSAHLNQPVKIPDTVPFILRSIITTALQKLPQRRFANAGEMLKSVRLAAEVLAVSQPSVALLSSPVRTNSPSTWEILHQDVFDEPVTHLAVDGTQIYLGMSNKISLQTYEGKNRGQGIGKALQHSCLIKLEAVKHREKDKKENLLTLNSYSQELWAITQSQESFSLYHLAKTSDLSSYEIYPLSPLFSLQAQQCVATLNPQGRWFSFVYALSQEQRFPSHFGRLILPSCKLHELPLDTPVPTQLVALDSRHGLAIYSSDNSQTPATVMRCFNRRGGWGEELCLPISLQSVTANLASPYSLFGIEPGEYPSCILIQLKPLRIKRIALDILPIFIIAQAWGYLLADQAGNIRLLDLEGFHLDACQLPLTEDEQITAIAAVESHEILVATWSQQQQGKLYITN